MSTIGKFITLEGVDGSGKTVQANKICEYLTSLGINNIHVREPGGTKFGESIRDMVLYNNQISSLTEVFLFFAARNELLKDVILPSLQNNIWVICDRFYDSTLVYQGILGEADIEDIMKIKDITMGDFEPDLTLIFDTNIETAMKRVAHRNINSNKYDLMESMKYQKIIEGYRKIAETFSFRSVIIKSTKTEEVVFRSIKDILHSHFSINLESDC